jgi:hypothetical protein
MICRPGFNGSTGLCRQMEGPAYFASVDHGDNYFQDLHWCIFSKTCNLHYARDTGRPDTFQTAGKNSRPMTELFYKTLFNTAPVPLIVTDRAGEILLVNERARAFLGGQAGALFPPNFADLIDRSTLKDQSNAETFSFADFLKAYETEHKHWIRRLEAERIYADINADTFESGNQLYYSWTLEAAEINDKLSHDLQERVKELSAIINIIEVFFATPDIETALKNSLEPIRQGWQFPAATGVSIQLGDGEVFSTENFRKTGWILRADIKSSNEYYGLLKVCYLTEVPAYEGAIFLPEEESLIRLIARLLGIFIEQWRSVEKIRADALVLKNITSQVPANTYQFEVLPDGKTNILFMNMGTDKFNYETNPDTAVNEILEAIYEPDKLKFRETVAQAYKANELLSVHYRVTFNDTIRWRWLRAAPHNGNDGSTIWYGASQDVTPIIDYITSIEQILFDISHIIRRPIANILGMTRLIKDAELDPDDMLEITKKLLHVFEQLDFYIRQLNIAYDKKRQLTHDLNIDFSSLVDNRDSFLDKTEP